MRFEVSEQIRTNENWATIVYALWNQMRKVSAKVQVTDEGVITATTIEASFISIVRFDRTVMIVQPKEGGFFCVAEVSYIPSSEFWMILVLCIPTFVAWLVPIVFYLIQKDTARFAVQAVFERIKNEFEVIEPSPR